LHYLSETSLIQKLCDSLFWHKWQMIDRIHIAIDESNSFPLPQLFSDQNQRVFGCTSLNPA
jgi:hypothetical protein